MEQLMTIEDVANYLKMSKNKIYTMAQRNLIPASKIGNQWRFTKNTLHDWIAQKSNRDNLNS